MCSPFVRKEANRLNWLVKGQLIDRSESDATVEKLYDSYFKEFRVENKNKSKSKKKFKLPNVSSKELSELRKENSKYKKKKYVIIGNSSDSYKKITKTSS